MKIHPRLFPAILALGLAGSGLARTWTDAQSGRTIEAEFIGLEDGTVSLERADGKTFNIPLSRLSAADQEFAKGQAATPAAAAAEWPTWRGPRRDDRSPDTGLLKEWPADGPPLLWTFDDAGKGYSSPAISGGRLYVTGSRKGKAQVICLDAATGKEIWGEAIGDDPESGYNTGWGGGPRGAPTVSDGMVYAMSANGEFACLSAADGSRKWRKDLVKDFGGKVPDWGYSESPLVDGDRVVVTPGGKDGAIVAFDKKSGKKLWASKGLEDDAQYSSLVPADVGGKRQYIQLFMNKLAGVDAESGEVVWTSDWKQGRTAVIPTPVFHDGKVYVTSGYGAGSKQVKIDGGKAEEIWENKVMKNHHGGVLLADGHIFGFSDGGGLVCQDFETGKQVWNKKGEGIQKGTVHYADGMLYCMDEEEGSVFLVDASPVGFLEHGRFKLPQETKLREGTQGKVWTHPVVIGGRLYLRDQDLVFCYDVKG
ncbi:PQQ-binding-like beta-propeller repeat protein [Luteolibacter marinus]|uniref:outer membrane protein assembly factor BamB family protein n=1 Tax=Luteolibacter marinus TaxID=2776705 RepID=UPI001D0187E8|nr:PQQ-binding-like beta-propeller repeat protein [Luteolibacter marinus]